MEKKQKKELTPNGINMYLDEKGCLCVSDQPWVTIAETAELAIALIKIEKKDKATELLSWIEKYIDVMELTGWVDRLMKKFFGHGKTWMDFSCCNFSL